MCRLQIFVNWSSSCDAALNALTQFQGYLASLLENVKVISITLFPFI